MTRSLVPTLAVVLVLAACGGPAGPPEAGSLEAAQAAAAERGVPILVDVFTEW